MKGLAKIRGCHYSHVHQERVSRFRKDCFAFNYPFSDLNLISSYLDGSLWYTNKTVSSIDILNSKTRVVGRSYKSYNSMRFEPGVYQEWITIIALQQLPFQPPSALA